MAARDWVRRLGPEVLLGVLACLTFLGSLGSMDLWGKREQRASAEAIDTVDHGRWLIAEIQGRKRLEKPPLPRWTIAGLMTLTGRRDEVIVRLPGALSALGMVGLVYGLGCRLGGRAVGLASGLVLTSMSFFIIELRQAGNDGPLAFFATLALYAAWRRLHGDRPPEPGEALPEQAGGRRWSLLMYTAMGLGILTKGPIILLVVALTVIPYVIALGEPWRGLRRLADGWGMAIFGLLALCWPVPVALTDPMAARVWYLEMAQKAGTAGIHHSRARQILAVDWPWMTFPWGLLAFSALIVPLLHRGREGRPKVWFAWWWTLGNLAMFCLWKVAKPNYYVPCLPGAALLAGQEWVRLCQVAREEGPANLAARRLLQLHWVIPFVAVLVAPVVVSQLVPAYLGVALAGAAACACLIVLSAWTWRRGANALALAPLVAAMTLGVLVAYGAVAPREDPLRSHRQLADRLGVVLPPDVRTVMFFHELDEGLWFYLRDRQLAPVPGSQPTYNEGIDLVQASKENRLILDPVVRIRNEQDLLVKWIREGGQASPYLLIRNKDYAQFERALAGLVTPLMREEGLDRNELTLLRVNPTAAASTATAPPEKAPGLDTPSTRR
ncbi:glycosyltransferase family 39 protein [Isosphaeraceae bacterium EP7]